MLYLWNGPRSYRDNRQTTRGVTWGHQKISAYPEVGRCCHEGRSRPSMVRFTLSLLGSRRRDPERVLPMRKKTSRIVTVKVDVAWCLFGIAAIIQAVSYFY